MANAATGEGYIPGPEGRTWYCRVGDGGAPPLVVVHGGPGGTHDYLLPLEALSDERPVIFYDQLGAGRSDVPADLSAWSNDQLVAELARLFDALGLENAHLLGQSWGGIVVTEFALQQPQRMISLVLASPCLSLPRCERGTAELRARLPAEVRVVLERHEASGTIDSPEYEDASLEFYRRHLYRLDPWPDELIRTFDQLNQTIYERLQGPTEFTITGIHKDYDTTPRLGEITMPVLVTCGRHDEMRPEDCAWYASLMPNAELVIFEESSHVAHLEEPERYLAVVRDFLRRVESRQADA